MIGRPPLPRAPHSGLHFVNNEKNAVLAAKALEVLQKIDRRRQITALALNRFDENCRHFFRIYKTLE